MRIRLIIPLIVAGCLAPASLAEGQQVPEVAGPDARGAAVAALDWVLSRFSDHLQDVTVVVSGLTHRTVSELDDDPQSYLLKAAPRRDLRLTGATLGRLADRAKVQIQTCDDLSTDLSLCDIPQPWVWVLLSNPGIRGNEAVVVVELLEHEDRGEDKPVMGAEIWEVVLSRDRGVWKVDRAAITGVS